ncbi:unnamed protein product [Nesidiocoris tenuis]|uniref:Uncharacterized protein n=1 Tax=Nesidiocoris tenuis TaxID=355587 RepID=A0A6H5HNV0_9HEMI|nr:unnamed protein product [Nesidiocoris tenuis]
MTRSRRTRSRRTSSRTRSRRMRRRRGRKRSRRTRRWKMTRRRRRTGWKRTRRRRTRLQKHVISSGCSKYSGSKIVCIHYTQNSNRGSCIRNGLEMKNVAPLPVYVRNR